ncbi:MAG: TVP38/TMEM64 family protein [Bdellovibrionales bacterium]
MKKHAINFILIAAALAMVYWILARDNSGIVSPWLLAHLQVARDFYSANPAITVLAFCCAHLLSSLLSLPGSCTLLNITSGAIFGFWPGCAIVYLITLFSACVMYFLAAHFHDHAFLKRYAAQKDFVRAHLQDREYLFLVALRLSPFVPYGILNAIMGVLRIPFRIYFISTIVGIFFDVVLLNNLGAGLGAVAAGSGPSEKSLAISFLVLFSVFFLLRLLLPRAYDQTSGTGRG